MSPSELGKFIGLLFWVVVLFGPLVAMQYAKNTNNINLERKVKKIFKLYMYVILGVILLIGAIAVYFYFV
jgi:uncharacterized Tic20 family protein